MPIARYGVLIGRPLHGVPGRGTNAHYQIHVVDRTTEYRIAVNVKSQLAPSEVEYLVDDDFRHPITETLRRARAGLLPAGQHARQRRRSTTSAATSSTAPACGRCRSTCPGPTTTSTIRSIASCRRRSPKRTRSSTPSGSAGGRKTAMRDKIFGFLPGNGIHDIHMNQGNSGPVRGRRRRVAGRRPVRLLPVGRSLDGDLPQVPVAELAHRRRHTGTPSPRPCRCRGARPDRRDRDRRRRRRASRICAFASSRRSSTRAATIRAPRR